MRKFPADEPGFAADMIGLVVYKGKIYTQTGTEIDFAAATNLMDKKIGITRGNIDEWSSQDDYAFELASTIGGGEVYTVKGYDSDFRLLIMYGSWAAFYECLNGITVSSGEDVFGKLKMADRVSRAVYVSSDNWQTEIYPLQDNDLVSRFIEALNLTVPYSTAVLGDSYYHDNTEEWRIIRIILEDGSKVTLRLHQDGYILYGFTDVAFKMESSLFAELWNMLDYSQDPRQG